MKRIISAALALTILVSCVFLAGCSEEKYPALVTYGDTEVSVNMFNYMLSQSKTMTLYSMSKTSDDASYWDTDQGKIIAADIMDNAIFNAKLMAYYAETAAQNGLSLTNEDNDEIKTMLDEMTALYGGKEGFNSAVANNGVNYDIIKDLYELQKLAEKGRDLVVGENGTHPITDDDYMTYYKGNYVTLRHINLNNVNKIDPTTSKAVPLTEEEKATVEAQATQIEVGLASGQALSDFASESADSFMSLCPTGLTLPTASAELLTLAYAAENEEDPTYLNIFGLYYYLMNNVEGFADAAVNLTEGEVKRLNTSKGIFFLQKLPLDMEMYDAFRNIMTETSSVESLKTRELIQEMDSQFTVDSDALSSFTVKGTSIIELPQQ